MELSKIRVSNYKSIMDVTLDIRRFDNSSTVILVGKNETGKTNLLQAIGFLAEPNEEYNYQALKNAQNDSSKAINFYYTFSFESNDEWMNLLESKVTAPKEFFEKINIKGIEKNVFLTADSTQFKSKNRFIIENPDNFLQKFCYRTISEDNQIYEIQHEKDASKTDDAKDYKKLTYLEFDKILNIIFTDAIRQESAIDVSKWKYSKENLITEIIDLNEFKDNSEICHPLKNIFNLADYKTQEEIKNVIEALSISPKNINKLEKILENAAKRHLNDVWPECKVMFKIKIQNDLKLALYVVDEGNEENSFYLTDRSEGFKQFISMIMGISASNSTDNLKNRVLIIDEPENHMHPSGIKYMRDELLRIGRNNYVFISTHSEHIIDTKNKERHYILTKINNNTCVKNWDKYDEMPNDEVLRQAFGLDILSEALKQYKIDEIEENQDSYMYKKALKILYPSETQVTDIQANIEKDKTEDKTSHFESTKNRVTDVIRKISSKIQSKIEDVSLINK